MTCQQSIVSLLHEIHVHSHGSRSGMDHILHLVYTWFWGWYFLAPNTHVFIMGWGEDEAVQQDFFPAVRLVHSSLNYFLNFSCDIEFRGGGGGGGVTRNIVGTHACSKKHRKGDSSDLRRRQRLRKRVVFQSNLRCFWEKGLFSSLTFDVFEKRGYFWVVLCHLGVDFTFSTPLGVDFTFFFYAI